jgi:hypothetical protein
MLYKGRIGIGIVVESMDQSGLARLTHGRKQGFPAAAPLEFS